MTVTIRLFRLLALSVLIVALLTACAGIRIRTQAPYVSLSNLQVLDVGLFEQRYRLQLRIQNPNSFALPISGMNYQLHINDKKFASGVSRQPVTIPAFGEELSDVDVVSDVGSLLEQFSGLALGHMQKVSYRLSGNISLAHSVLKLPFEYKGEVDLNFGNSDSGP